MVIAVALPFNWLAAEMKQARRQKAVVEAIEKCGGAEYDFLIDADGLHFGSIPAQQGFLWRMLGDDFFGDITEADVTVLREADPADVKAAT